MIYRATKKVEGGKLVKVIINAEKSGQINAVKITGDFFLHPEDTISEIEKNLAGLPANTAAPQISEKIQETLNTKKAAFVGVSPDDIAETIIEALQTEPATSSSW